MGLYRTIRPLLFLLPPECAHKLTIKALSLARKILPKPSPDDYILKIDALGLTFSNPFGIAAGFDKNAEALDSVLRLGYGFAEVGTVTPHPQAGNPSPRLFRLVAQEAVINRLGFNNEGHEAVRTRFSRRSPFGIVGVNVGVNKDADAQIENYIADYETGALAFAEYASYLTINVSSPNTPGLRNLQSKAPLTRLINKVKKAAPRLPIVLKIAPDLTQKDMKDIAEVALKTKIAGLIVANTTLDKLLVEGAKHEAEEGGLSGKPLFEKSTEVLAQMRRLTKGHITLIGVGGVSSAEDAYAKIRAGARLIQLYSALIYQGPLLVGQLKRELAELLRADGYDTLAQAVGADVSLDDALEYDNLKHKSKPTPKRKPKPKTTSASTATPAVKKGTRKMTVTIYHNPRCRKSRQTLALLEEKGEKLNVVEYLNAPLDETALKAVLKKLGMPSARDLMRKGEADYKALGLKDVEDEFALISAMAAHPKLMERPLVVKGRKAALGRPPEQVLDIL